MTPRIALLLAGAAALALPLPSADPLGVALTLLGAIALARSLQRPGSTAPAALIGLAALSWLAAPAGHAHDGRLAALALALALAHASAGLAAVTPARSAVPAGILLRWGAWTVAATTVGVGVVAAVSQLPRLPAPVPATAAAVLALGAVLALTLRLTRATRGDPDR